MYDDYNLPHSDLLIKVRLPLLQIRRIRSMAVETFKIINYMSQPVLSDLVVERDSNVSFKYTIFYRYHKSATTKLHSDMLLRYSGTPYQNTLDNAKISQHLNHLFYYGTGKNARAKTVSLWEFHSEGSDMGRGRGATNCLFFSCLVAKDVLCALFVYLYLSLCHLLHVIAFIYMYT